MSFSLSRKQLIISVAPAAVVGMVVTIFLNATDHSYPTARSASCHCECYSVPSATLPFRMVGSDAHRLPNLAQSRLHLCAANRPGSDKDITAISVSPSLFGLSLVKYHMYHTADPPHAGDAIGNRRL